MFPSRITPVNFNLIWWIYTQNLLIWKHCLCFKASFYLVKRVYLFYNSCYCCTVSDSPLWHLWLKCGATPLQLWTYWEIDLSKLWPLSIMAPTRRWFITYLTCPLLETGDWEHGHPGTDEEQLWEARGDGQSEEEADRWEVARGTWEEMWRNGRGLKRDGFNKRCRCGALRQEEIRWHTNWRKEHDDREVER